MKLQKIYTSLLTSDLDAAEVWYTKLLGRRPDYRPMDTLVQWELFDPGGLMLSNSDEIAGKGVMFLYVDDLSAERRRLEGHGIALDDDIPGDYSTLAQLRDPDGNLITLATPPAQPFPPALPRRKREIRGMAPNNSMHRTTLRAAADAAR
jgi:catechol 2,3-dioxygenase-like lactoylglutathione lyase family enzyme